jgi:lipopolysaccharide transport system ATP-binding protein
MDDIAIRVTGLGKRYRIGAIQDSERTFAETLRAMALKPFHSFRSIASGGSGASSETFVWALKDVSFEVKRGEAIGVIGHNGAGKSTLLKILTRITNPTDGRAEIRGRVGSLLEVGTGFNGELTGRENIYMSGAILGMRKREINAKFDEIVDFSGVEKFIDTPVKRYSSGMYLRLAFAVAAHLEPEVLLVDEVLAVGDAEFQKKCLGKMGDVTSSGRTILFVSHNMGAVQNLCPRSLVLSEGEILFDDVTSKAIPRYLDSLNKVETHESLFDVPREQAHWGYALRISNVTILDQDEKPASVLPLGMPFSVEMECVCLEDLQNVSLVLGIDTIMTTPVTTVASEEVGQLFHGRKGDVFKAKVHFADFMLNTGRYYVRASARSGKRSLDWLRSAAAFDVSDYRDNKAASLEVLDGVVRYVPQWQKLESAHYHNLEGWVAK